MTVSTTPATKLAVCVTNTGYGASLERRKIYSLVADSDAKKHKLVRVIDESGEDYLYPESFFVAVTLPPATRQAVLAAV